MSKLVVTVKLPDDGLLYEKKYEYNTAAEISQYLKDFAVRVQKAFDENQNNNSPFDKTVQEYR